MTAPAAEKKAKRKSAHGAIMSFWTDIPKTREADFNAWYDTEHFPERLAVPGFRCGLRYVALRGRPKYMAFYEIDRPAVLRGKAYLGRLNDPTPWTQKTMRSVTNAERIVYLPKLDLGRGHGAALWSARFVSEKPADKVQGALEKRLQQLAGRLQRVRLWQSDTGLSDVESEERRLRGDGPSPQSWCVILEATTHPALADAMARHPLDKALQRAGLTTKAKVGHYRMMSVLRAGEP